MDQESSIMPRPHRPSVAVRRTLRKLGMDIRDARRRRGQPGQVVPSAPSPAAFEHRDLERALAL
jgi:hypothetical protein